MPSDAPPVPHLPLELLEQVICLVHRDDPSSLNNCSCASSDLAVISQKRIFQEILFTPDSSLNVTGETFSKFYELLKTSPHIAAYVQNLVIDNAFLAVSTRNQFLKKTLPLLKSLRQIGLSKPRVRADSFWWYFMDVKTRDALLDVFKSSHITDIDLTGIRDFPPEQCFCFTAALKRLSMPTLVFDRSTINPLAHLDPTHITEVPLGIKFSHGPRPKLEALAIVDVLDNGLTLPWLTSPIPISPVDLSQLQSLRLDFEEVTSTNTQNSSKLDMALRFFSHTLTHIRFNVLQRNMSFFLWSESQGWTTLQRAILAPPTLNIAHELQSMTIDSRVFQHPRDSEKPLSYRCPLPWIAWLLDNSSELILKNLTINISLCRITHSILQNLDWSKLANSLTANILWKGTTVDLRLQDLQQSGMETLGKNESFVDMASGGIIISHVIS